MTFPGKRKVCSGFEQFRLYFELYRQPNRFYLCADLKIGK